MHTYGYLAENRSEGSSLAPLMRGSCEVIKESSASWRGSKIDLLFRADTEVDEFKTSIPSPLEFYFESPSEPGSKRGVSSESLMTRLCPLFSFCIFMERSEGRLSPGGLPRPPSYFSMLVQIIN